MQRCPSCQSADHVENIGSQIMCTFCGTVLEDSQIVSDVTFAENSAGGAVVQGSYVGNEQRGVRTQGPGGFRSGGAGASREQTVANAKHAIRALGISKQVPQNVIDKAGRLFMLALEGGTYRSDGSEPQNYVLGRKAEYTQASCLYVACRMERTNHMLIDFADAIGVNVFILGRSYLRLVRCLGFKLPVVDPSIYISRFASLLDFGDETQRVATDATRLVQRFKKDWITHGRRPAGVCGACLLLAARMNNFRRSVAEIIQVVKIADVTLRKRLEDFKQTPSSKLTIDDFRNIWLEEESEPPAYYLARMPKKSKKSADERRSVKRLKSDVLEGLGEYVDEEEGPDDADEEEEDGNEADDEENEGDRPAESVLDPRLDNLADEATRAEIAEYLDDDAAREAATSTVVKQRDGSVAPRQQPEGVVAKTQEDAVDELADLDEEELDAFINTEEEVKIKERVWIEFNKDYLERMLERQLKMEADIKAGIRPATQSRSKRRSNKPRDSSTAPPTAAESAKQMMRKRNFSKRLNYDAINSLFDDPEESSHRRKAGAKKQEYEGDEDDEDDEDEDDEDRHRQATTSSKRKRRMDGESGMDSETDHTASRYTDVETDNDDGQDDWRKGLAGITGAAQASGADDDDDDLYEGEGDGIFD